MEKWAPSRVDEIGIYLHWPFCKRRCGYCHFYTESFRDYSPLKSLAQRILQESEFYVTEYSKMGQLPIIKTLYLGGGTPTSLKPEDLYSLVHGLAHQWQWEKQAPVEITLEANPEDLSPELFGVMEEVGITRLSLGVQSFQNDLLEVLERTTRREQIERALREFRSYRWKLRPRLSLDLMIGIPNQNSERLQEDLNQLLHWDPDHVSLYGLSIDPGTRLYQAIRRGKLRPLSIDLSEELWEIADTWLEDHGWQNYEISNYARAGAQSQHNIRYWQLQPWLGLGPGAVGTLPAHVSEISWPLRRKNSPLSHYFPEHEVFFLQGENEWISRAEFYLDFLITGLRLVKGISFHHLDQIFEVDSKKILARWLEELDQKGYLCFSESQLKLNRRGRFALDRLLLGVIDVVKNEPSLVHGPPPKWPLSQ